jgi:hypothetical protein
MHFLWGKHKQRAKSHLHATVIHAESKWKTKIECRRYRYSVFQINSVCLQVYSGVTLHVPHFPYKSFPSQCAYKRRSTICPRKTRSFKYLEIWFFKRFIAKQVCTACSSTNNNIVLLTDFNKYLYRGKCEIKVNINNSGEKSLKNKNTAPVGELITAECASVVYVCISCTQQSGRLSIIPDLFDQGVSGILYGYLFYRT